MHISTLGSKVTLEAATLLAHDGLLPQRRRDWADGGRGIMAMVEGLLELTDLADGGRGVEGLIELTDSG